MLDIEFVKITPEIEVPALEPFLASGAGSACDTSSHCNSDLLRLADRLGAISERAALWPWHRASILSIDPGPRSRRGLNCNEVGEYSP